MQISPTYSNEKSLGIHPDVLLSVVDVPKNAPEEVKRI